LYKENATAFLDGAALYGLHANGAGKLYVAENETPLTTKDDIYGMMNGFYSKNKIYVYIQANRQRSYNFYDNYIVSDTNSNNLKIGETTGSLTETTFGTFERPIHETTTTVSSPVENTSFAFQLTTDNYADASMYVQLGRVASEHEENFIRDKNLLQQDPEIDQTFTQDIVVNINATASAVICSYVNVLCESREMLVEAYVPASDPTADPQDIVIKDIDDVFGLLDAVIVNTPGSDVQLPTIINERLQIINFPNTSANNDIAAVKYQKIEDRLLTDEEDTYVNRVTYETLLSDITRDASPYKSNNSSHIDSAKSSIQTYADNQNRFYEPRLPYKLEKSLFTDNETTVTGVSLTVADGSRPTKKIIGLLDTELLSLKSLMQTNNISNTRLYFIKQSISDKESFTSIENVKYYKYHVGVVGEDATGELKLFEPQDGIILYSLDQFVFASTKYSEYIPELRQKNYTNIEIPEE
jgi:hypothetical protein